jgi:chaperone required for assembly of F1-ATPase
MARVFAYFMERKVQMTDKTIFDDTSNTIKKALQKTFSKSASKTSISETAFEIALNELIKL